MTKETNVYNGWKPTTSINSVGKTVQLPTKESNWTSKWIKDFNVLPETIKLLEENIDIRLFDISLSNIYIYFFLDLSPQAKETKAKTNKWDYIELKSFFTVKETINKTKRYPTEWGEDNCKWYIW